MPNGNDFSIVGFLADFLIGNDEYSLYSTDFIKANKLVSIFDKLNHKPSPDFEVLSNGQRAKRRLSEVAHRRIGKHFADASLKYAVIKGASFEKTIYGNSAFRDIGDIDILVGTKDAEKAHTVLLQMGYKQQLGPSSGSINPIDKASFIAKISQQKLSTAKTL